MKSSSGGPAFSHAGLSISQPYNELQGKKKKKTCSVCFLDYLSGVRLQEKEQGKRCGFLTAKGPCFCLK